MTLSELDTLTKKVDAAVVLKKKADACEALSKLFCEKQIVVPAFREMFEQWRKAAHPFNHEELATRIAEIISDGLMRDAKAYIAQLEAMK